MRKSITKLIACCALVGGMHTPVIAQLQSGIDFTLKQQTQIELLTKVYEQQGLDIKQARMKAEEEVAPEVLKLRVGVSGGVPTSTLRPDLNPWPTTYAGWIASAPYPGSIEVDRDTFIHTFKPSDLVKKILLKAYTPEDEARIQNVRFLGFNGVQNGGDGWTDDTTPNPSLLAYATENRGLAYFTKGTSSFDIEKGLLLSTGHTWGHEGPNESRTAFNSGVGQDGWAFNRGNSFDPDLTTIAGQSTTVGGILTFDFCPAIDKSTIDYVFGSEEYPEFVHSGYNDVFGFFVSGPYDTPGGSETVDLPNVNAKGLAIYNGDTIHTYHRFNIAQLPNGMPVGVDWTNWGQRPGSNDDLVWDTPWKTNITAPWDTVGLGALLAVNPTRVNLHGSNSTLAFNPQYHRINKHGNAMMELDGITVKLTALMDGLVPGKWYRLKIGISQVDINHGDGVFIGNLDLGQTTSGIGNNNGWASWPAANDLPGLTHFYGGCPDTLTVDFDPQGFTQYVEIIPQGVLAGNMVDMEGNPLVLKDSLLSGQSRIVRIFKVSEDASFESGAEGWFETYSYDPATHAGNPNPSNALAGDTTDIYNLYKRFTSNVVFNRPTTGYAGRLDLNIKDGSPSLFRSVNGGFTWENAYLPFTPSQLIDLAEKENAYIMLKEPNSCWNETISLGGGIVSPGIQRPVWMPEVSNAILSCQPGVNYITSRQHFVFTITPTGVNVGEFPGITTDRTSTPDSKGVKIESEGDGSYTVTIYNVQEPIRVSIGFATGNTPTSNASVKEENKIWPGNGQLHIKSAITCAATIYNASGKLVNTVACIAGQTVSTVLPAGFYIVALSNGNVYKAVVK